MAAAWEDALGTLVQDRGDALLQHAYLLSGDPVAAADLVQEALLATFQRLRQGTDVTAIEAYVRRVILRRYLDQQRKARRFRAIRHLLDRSESAYIIEETVTDADDARLLSLLTPQQRACVIMRFYEDLTVPQIADRLDCGTGSVKRHLSDAVRRMGLSLETEREGIAE